MWLVVGLGRVGNRGGWHVVRMPRRLAVTLFPASLCLADEAPDCVAADERLVLGTLDVGATVDDPVDAF